VIGSRCGPFPRAIAALSSRSIDVRPLIGAELELDDAHAAFEAAATPGARKILLRVNPEEEREW
jgi:threonine dehydrogenase-like Zn-dependent dehydrogenase